MIFVHDNNSGKYLLPRFRIVPISELPACRRLPVRPGPKYNNCDLTNLFVVWVDTPLPSPPTPRTPIEGGWVGKTGETLF